MKRQRPGLPPLSVRVEVAKRQYAESKLPLAFLGATVGPFGSPRLGEQLTGLLRLLFGEQKLHLDHDPALRLRKYNPRIKNVAARYEPHAHDPRFLLYRPVAPEAERSHTIKTYVRGENGQFSDQMLINRERRREKRASKKTAKVRTSKRKHGPKLCSGNRWPPKGSRPIGSRP